MTAEEDIRARLARLPLETVTVSAAGRAWRIEAVRDHAALLGASDDMERFPFGLLLWESALVLADALAAEPGGLAGRRVLEIGAGVGLAGLAARWLGGDVVQSDHSGEALALCSRNARLNAVAGIAVRVGDWMDWRDAQRYDLVIGSDVLYEEESHAPLLDVLTCAVAAGGQIILTDPGRPLQSWFTTRLQTMGWQVRLETRTVAALQPLRPGETVDVTIIRARPPK